MQLQNGILGTKPKKTNNHHHVPSVYREKVSEYELILQP